MSQAEFESPIPRQTPPTNRFTSSSTSPSLLAFSLFWIWPLHWATTTTSTSEVSHIYWKVYRALAMAPALVFAPPSSTLGFGLLGYTMVGIVVVFSMLHRRIRP
ncbi:unnamed protein product [Prunus brigantina]